MPNGTDAEDKLSYLSRKLVERSEDMKKNLNWYRRRYYLATMTSVVLGAAITILAGWKPDLSPLSIPANNFILALGAITTVVAAWTAFFSPREAWAQYTTTLMRLHVLRQKVGYASCDPLFGSNATDQVDALFNEFQKILNEHYAAMDRLRAPTRSPNDH